MDEEATDEEATDEEATDELRGNGGRGNGWRLPYTATDWPKCFCIYRLKCSKTISGWVVEWLSDCSYSKSTLGANNNDDVKLIPHPLLGFVPWISLLQAAHRLILRRFHPARHDHDAVYNNNNNNYSWYCTAWIAGTMNGPTLSNSSKASLNSAFLSRSSSASSAFWADPVISDWYRHTPYLRIQIELAQDLLVKKRHLRWMEHRG